MERLIAALHYRTAGNVAAHQRFQRVASVLCSAAAKGRESEGFRQLALYELAKLEQALRGEEGPLDANMQTIKSVSGG